MASSRLGNPAWQDGVGSVLSRARGDRCQFETKPQYLAAEAPADAMAAMARRLERKFAAEGG